MTHLPRLEQGQNTIQSMPRGFRTLMILSEHLGPQRGLEAYSTTEKLVAMPSARQGAKGLTAPLKG